MLAAPALPLQLEFEQKYSLDQIRPETVHLADENPGALLLRLRLDAPEIEPITAEQKIVLVMQILKFHTEQTPKKIVKSIKKLGLEEKKLSLLATFIIWNLDRFPKIQTDEYLGKLLNCVIKKHIKAVYKAGVPKERFIQIGRISARILKNTVEWGKALKTHPGFEEDERKQLGTEIAAKVRRNAIKYHQGE